MNLELLTQFVIEYCRLDYDLEGDSYYNIERYVLASIEYIKNATGVTLENVDSDNSLYKLAVAMLSTHWYENRSITTSENNTSLKHSLSYILMQLKNCYGGN